MIPDNEHPTGYGYGEPDHFDDEVHEMGAEARSGATGSGVSVAVSFALNVASVDTLAQLSDGSTTEVTGGGLTLRAESIGEDFLEYLDLFPGHMVGGKPPRS